MGSILTCQQITYLRVMLGDRVSRLQDARRQEDAGASAIELAVITAILVAAAVFVVVIIYNIVQQKGNAIQQESNTNP